MQFMPHVRVSIPPMQLPHACVCVAPGVHWQAGAPPWPLEALALLALLVLLVLLALEDEAVVAVLDGCHPVSAPPVADMAPAFWSSQSGHPARERRKPARAT